MARISTERKPRDIGDGLPPGAVVGSMTIHSLILVFLGWGATRVTLPDAPLVYRVELVAAPSQVSARPVPAPKRQKPPEPEPKKSKVPETVPAVTEKPKKSAKPEETKQEKSVPEEAVVAAAAAAAPNESKQGDVAEPVRLEGAAFPYPDYLANIILQIKRHWRPPAAGRGLKAELAFTIMRDGSVIDLQWVQRSGSLVFDLEARGAIETAGRREAFGPLPQGYPSDQLRVSFFFDPTRY